MLFEVKVMWLMIIPLISAFFPFPRLRLFRNQKQRALEEIQYSYFTAHEVRHYNYSRLTKLNGRFNELVRKFNGSLNEGLDVDRMWDISAELHMLMLGINLAEVRCRHADGLLLDMKNGPHRVDESFPFTVPHRICEKMSGYVPAET